MNSKNQAVRLAQYYFRTLAEASGVPWDSDNDAEVEAMIEAIIAAGVQRQDRIALEIETWR